MGRAPASEACGRRLDRPTRSPREDAALNLSAGKPPGEGMPALLMLENINESAEWIPDIEASNTPWFTDRTILQWNLGFLEPA